MITEREYSNVTDSVFSFFYNNYYVYLFSLLSMLDAWFITLKDRMNNAYFWQQFMPVT